MFCWADQLAGDLRDVLGYTLIATTRQVRLIRRLDALDPTQTTIFTAKSGRPFDRRRLAYLCLFLASFSRSRVEISLANLVRAFTPTANAIDALGFNPVVSAHKAAVVDVLDWLADRGALRLSDGSVEAWTADTERGDALYDIDHDICAVLFRPARPVQHLTSAAGLLDATFTSAKRAAQREAAAQRAARALVEHPVVYYAQVEPEVAEALRQPGGVAENLARLTGLAVERRAEGVLLADAGGGSPTARSPVAAALSTEPTACSSPRSPTSSKTPTSGRRCCRSRRNAVDQRELLERIDAALPLTGVVTELAWTAPAEEDAYLERTRGSADLGSLAKRSAPARRSLDPNASRTEPALGCPNAPGNNGAAEQGHRAGSAPVHHRQQAPRHDQRPLRRGRRRVVHRHLAARPARPADRGRRVPRRPAAAAPGAGRRPRAARRRALPEH